MSYTPEQTSGFSYAMAIALALHGLVILGVTFSSAKSVAPDTQMEVTLSHSSSERPEEADFIAEHNQEGSGVLDEQATPTNTVKPLFEDTSIKPVSPIQLPEEQQAADIAVPRIITTSGDSDQAIASETATESLEEKTSDGSEQKKSLAELSREIASLEAKLAERQQLFTKKPRVLVLTSASTMAANNAAYIHNWRDRIEAVGNLHYPEKARNEKLYGDVRLLVGVNANGTVEEIKVLESSGIETLDRAAMESIRLASPFEPFNRELAAEYDRIDIIRTWQFRKNRLSSSAN